MNMQEFSKKLANFEDISKFVVTFCLGLFFFVSIFGLALSISKQFHLNTVQCSSSQQQNGCKSVSQHVSNWQSAFAATEFEVALSLLALILGLVLHALWSEKIYFIRYFIISSQRNFHRRFKNFLILAISRGILQPTR